MRKFRALIFDLDGVVYRGSTAIHGVQEAIEKLRTSGISALFLTNNATKTRAQYAARLSEIGIQASENEIMTSSYGVAMYIRKKFGAGKSAFVIGEEGMLRELQSAGIRVIDSNSSFIPDFVVVSLDRSLTYEKAAAAHRFIIQGAIFLAANSDPTLPLERLSAPGSGSIVSMLEKSTGKNAEVIGKPGLFMLKELLREHSLSPKDAAFVGDRLEIDIAMANKAGLYSILVLSGVATADDAKKVKGNEKPKAILNSAAGLPKFLRLE